MPTRRLLIAAPLTVLLAACAGDDGGQSRDDEQGDSEADDGSEADADSGADDDGTDTGEEPAVDEQAVVEQALGYADFERINAEPLPSLHGLAELVNIWVPAELADDYRALDPEDDEQQASFPAGALIVKEHLDASGEPVGMTLMFKAEPGYDPERRDWWWGGAQLDGTLTASGRVDFCIGCHSPRSSADWLFGVASDDQS